jgi:hypothetical protein
MVTVDMSDISSRDLAAELRPRFQQQFLDQQMLGRTVGPGMLRLWNPVNPEPGLIKIWRYPQK